jgi:hypothetical protein
MRLSGRKFRWIASQTPHMDPNRNGAQMPNSPTKIATLIMATFWEVCRANSWWGWPRCDVSLRSGGRDGTGNENGRNRKYWLILLNPAAHFLRQPGVQPAFPDESRHNNFNQQASFSIYLKLFSPSFFRSVFLN